MASRAGWLCAGLLSLAGLQPGFTVAQETPKAEPSVKGLQLQPLDDPALPLEPVTPRSAEKQQQMTAEAWVMTGRVMQQRQKFQEALNAYERALKIDANNEPALRRAVEVALQLRNVEKAADYANRVIQLNPDDVELLRWLALQRIGGRQLDQAVKLLEQARQSKKLDPKTAYYVLINRDLGILYGDLGEVEKAADCFDVVLSAVIEPAKFALDPRARDELLKNAASSFERIGQVLLGAKRYDRAQLALEKAVAERSGRPGGANYTLAQLYQQKGENEKSLEQLDLFFSSRVKRGRGPYQLLEKLLKDTGKEDSLLPRLETLVQDDPKNRDLKHYLAAAFIARNKLDEAEKVYRDSLADGASADAHIGLASVFRRRGQAAELVEQLAQALERTREIQAVAQEFEAEFNALQQDEKLLEAAIAAVREEAKARASSAYSKIILVARMAGQAKKTDIAIEFFRLALQVNPAQAALVYRQLSDLLLEQERYEESIALYREALENPLMQGAKPDYLIRLATVLEMVGKTDEALQAVADANDLVPGGHELIDYREAWIYYHAQRLDQAREKFEAFLKKHPEDGGLNRQVKFSLSSVYVQLGDNRKGEEILEKFLTEHPDDVGVNNDLGYLYADQGRNLEKAKTMIEKAVQAEPKNPAYLDSMGWVLFKLGQTAEAITWLEKATQLENGDDATIWEHLGDCHHKQGANDKARTAWQKALDLAKADKRPEEKLVKRIEEKLKTTSAASGTAKTESDKAP